MSSPGVGFPSGAEKEGDKKSTLQATVDYVYEGTEEREEKKTKKSREGGLTFSSPSDVNLSRSLPVNPIPRYPQRPLPTSPTVGLVLVLNDRLLRLDPLCRFDRRDRVGALPVDDEA